MTLLLTLVAAVVVTLVWYTSEKARRLKVGLLCYLFWGGSLMWLVDGIAAYIQLGVAYFTPAWEELLNDAFLGLAVITLALLIWMVAVLLQDPLGVLRGRRGERS